MMADRITIQDIARLAGVSKATVSRVINQKPDVDAITRERVLRIMDEHEYVPNVAAAGLAGGRPRLVGVLVPSLTWPLMPQIMLGVGEGVESSSYGVVLYSMSKNQDCSAIIDRILAARLTSGLLAVFPGQSAEHLNDLHDQGFPVVMIDDQGQPGEVPWVGTDNRVGAYAAVRHLLDLGHTRIGHIQGPSHYQVSLDRYRGYCDALLEAGITPDPELVTRGDFKQPSGRVAGLELLTKSAYPTAIFAGNDEMAYGVLDAAEEVGLHPPRDLAVVGFDDITPSAHVRPALTTIRQPLFEMGRQGIELLLSLVDSPRLVTSSRPSTSLSTVMTGMGPIRVQLPSNLVVRESSGLHLKAAVAGQSSKM
ncbi:MAG: LacI family DNA-binding transcriptional regulator [Ktedonobacterales bacterium]